MSDTEYDLPAFLDRTIALSNGESYEILRPLTDYRSCHDGTPFEARQVFLCRRVLPAALADQFVLKVKFQLPALGATPHEGPSTTTAHELIALTQFRDVKMAFAPRLVAFDRKVQDDRGPFPGGYMTFTVMTKMPGFALFGKYWNMPGEERDEITPKAVEALLSIYKLGIEPVDRGLRNVIWDPETKRCSIIDFELWNETKTVFPNEKAELQRWGLLRTPPAKDHWAAWNQMYR